MAIVLFCYGIMIYLCNTQATSICAGIPIFHHIQHTHTRMNARMHTHPRTNKYGTQQQSTEAPKYKNKNKNNRIEREKTKREQNITQQKSGSNFI